MNRARALMLALALPAMVLVSSPPGVAFATTVRHVAITGTDTGDCSVTACRTIGYAISQSVSGDTIEIGAGTYPEHVVVDRSITLEGAGAGATTVDGSNRRTVIAIGAPSDSLTVKVTGLAIDNGKAQTGGGIASLPGSGQSNAVTLNAVVVANNRAVGAVGLPSALGGGIYNGAGSTLTLIHSTVEGNAATGFNGYAATPAGSGLGGGVYNAGSLTIAKSSVAGNSARGGSGCVRACTALALRPGPGEGGGIDTAGSATIVQSTLSGNKARGGDVLEAAVVAGGLGSGGGLEGGAVFVNSTLSGNSARGGNSRAGPAGSASGGGIHATAAETLTNSTIAANKAVGGAGTSPGTESGGGIELAGGSATLTNAILARNRADSGPNCLGTISSDGHNLVGNDSSCSGFTGTDDLVNADPVLGPLQNNGGPTFTMALLAGSPAIGAADDVVCAALPVSGVDQRGYPRPGGPHCDIGAYEVQ